jgi:hypothetical protein
MIQPLDNSSGQQAPSSKTASSGSTGGASFAQVLASAKTGGASSDAQTGTITGDLKTDLKPPKGETWGPVNGHTDYADILSGPRNGFFVSLTGPRKGQAFVIVHKDGKTYHVYGSGKNKQTVAVKPNPADFTPLKGETWQPVAKHHDYKQIDGGKRNKQYVNLSGNDRTGETFTIDRHDGKTYHVYGSGKDKHEVAVGGHRKHTTSTPQTTTPQKTDGNASQPG